MTRWPGAEREEIGVRSGPARHFAGEKSCVRKLSKPGISLFSADQSRTILFFVRIMPLYRSSSRSGFTLIELLVVLGVIAVFIGVFATALRPGNPTVAVEGAQAQVASLFTQARGVALKQGAETRLIVNANPSNPDRYLRFLGIVYDGNTDGDNDGGTGNDWIAATDGVTLPGSVYVVPPDGVGTPDGMTWESKLNSSFSDSSETDSLQYISNEPEDYYYITFTSRGLVPQDTEIILSVSTAVSQPQGDGIDLAFDAPGATRGAILRQYGSFVLLNEPDAYPE